MRIRVRESQAPVPPESSTQPQPSRASSPSTSLQQEPKRLFRLLEQVFAAADDNRGGRQLLAWCVREFFTAFEEELALDCALLFSRRRRRYHLTEAVGSPPRYVPPTLQEDQTPLHGLGGTQHTVRIEHGPNWAPRPMVGALIEEARARHVLLLLPREESRLSRVEGVVRTLRAALSARILQNRWGSALREAAEIQRCLVPSQPPTFPGFEFAARSQPAEEVGGDIYDFLPQPGGPLGFAIADASGHGLPAALVARDVMVGLRMGVRCRLKVTRMLADVNGVVHAAGLASSFVSAFFAELGQDGSVLYANAGHPPPLLRSVQGIVELERGDMVLGPSPDVQFRRRFCQLRPGDLLVAYTDGILERSGAGEAFFGVEGVRSVVDEMQGASAQEVLDRIFEAAHAFGRGDDWDDDATVLVIRRLPAAR